MSAIQDLLNAAGNLSALGEHWRKLVAAAEAEMKELEWLKGELERRLEIFERAACRRDQRDAELREAFREYIVKPFATHDTEKDRLWDALERWAKAGAP